jgi:hypothetical protein
MMGLFLPLTQPSGKRMGLRGASGMNPSALGAAGSVWPPSNLSVLLIVLGVIRYLCVTDAEVINI